MHVSATTFALAMLASASTALADSKSSDVLKYGTPEAVGMLSKPLNDMVYNLTQFTKSRNWTSHSSNQVVPIEPGGSTIIAHKGTIVSHFAFGKRLLWGSVNGSEGTLLPAREQEDATIETIYDMASLTKMFTTVAVLRCIDSGKITLNATVASYLRGFAVNDKAAVTILQLLTHTAGFDADPVPGLFDPMYPTYKSRVQAILSQKLVYKPGTKYLYSDVSFMTLMLVVEEVTGKTLDANIAEYTSLMGMHKTFFNRGNIEGSRFPHYKEMAAQEFQHAVEGNIPGLPQRPQPVRGTVHDENAWALNGVSGHAGLFSTTGDTARFCQMILNKGTYAGHRILSQKSVDLIFTNFLADLGEDHGAGFELNQYYTAGPMANIQAASHTGFTGTSMVIDRASATFFVHLANRVHPSRNWSSNNIVRETLGAWVATALQREVEFPS